MELGYSYILRQKGDMIFLKKEISPTSASAYSKKKRCTMGCTGYVLSQWKIGNFMSTKLCDTSGILLTWHNINVRGEEFDQV
jgi:hypothetical protein